MKIYLAGPMSNLPGYNYPAFDKAAAKLRAAGHTVFSPADNDRFQGYTTEIMANGGKVSPELKRRIIHDDLTWICKHADAIAYLPGWDGSSIPPCVEDDPKGLPGLHCRWEKRVGLDVTSTYICTWDGSPGAKLENALVDWLGGFTKIDIPREWII